jgi:lipoprotein-anchoring transpeptidase ErfK/SrfK
MSLGAFSRGFLGLILATSCSVAFASGEGGNRQLEKWEKKAIAEEAPEATPEQIGEELNQDGQQTDAQETDAQPLMLISPVKTNGIDIYVDKTSQTMQVFLNGQGVYTFPVSTARKGYHTPTGNFRIQRMEPMWYSRKYDMSPMPHSMFFQGGYAIHGHGGKFPRFASHGCVRLRNPDAETLYNLVEANGKSSVSIHISEQGSQNIQVQDQSQDQQNSSAQAQPKKKKGDGTDRYFHRNKKTGVVEPDGLY